MISGSVRLAPGLGLTNRFIIDQHFRQRDRLGRLLAAVSFNPFAIGVGAWVAIAWLLGRGLRREALQGARHGGRIGHVEDL